MDFPETKEEKSEEKTSEDGTVGELLGVNSPDDSEFAISLEESNPDLKVGDSFNYTLKIENSKSEAARNVEVLLALPPENAAVQKDSIMGPTKADLNASTGLLHFATIPGIAPGETVQFSIPVKTLKAGAFQAHVQILEGGAPKSKKTQETTVK